MESRVGEPAVPFDDRFTDRFGKEDASTMASKADLTLAERMEVHINTLYCSDAEGRLRMINEAEVRPAPLFYMGRTLQGNFWRFRHDLPAAAVEELDRLCRTEPVATEL